MRIDPQKHGWMTQRETHAVMGALGEARFVGGAVRNALAQAPVVDIDIAVPLAPEIVMRRLEAAGIKAIPTGFDHGTVTAILRGKVFEITSLRRDVATDGRHARVSYTDDWAEDAARRDFTMNALYAAEDGEIFDYAGGVEDLIAGRVCFVGDPAARIAEDYLRILRLFRFQAWYGKGEIDAPALRAAAAAKANLARLSGERIARELLRLLECENPAPVLRIMAACGVLPELLPYALALSRLEQLVRIDAENGFPPDPILRLAALLPNDPAAVQGTAARLKLSNADRSRLEALAADDGASRNAPRLSARHARALLYRIGAPLFKDRIRLNWAAAAPGANAIAYRMLLGIADDWTRPNFPLSGHDVMLAGVAAGPSVGRILSRLEDWWVAEDFSVDPASLAQRLKQMVQAGDEL